MALQVNHIGPFTPERHLEIASGFARWGLGGFSLAYITNLALEALDCSLEIRGVAMLFPAVLGGSNTFFAVAFAMCPELAAVRAPGFTAIHLIDVPRRYPISRAGM